MHDLDFAAADVGAFLPLESLRNGRRRVANELRVQRAVGQIQRGGLHVLVSLECRQIALGHVPIVEGERWPRSFTACA
jgi:hypothetical protein